VSGPLGCLQGWSVFLGVFYVAFKFNRNNSNYSKHALTHAHSFGPIHKTIQILQFQNKEAHLNTIEKFYIYKDFSEINHLNDEQNISPNKIFDTILKATSQS
jgi:hypothetical protein